MTSEDRLRCSWIAFINCFVGIVVISTLTIMSVVSYSGITTLRVRNPESGFNKRNLLVIASTWVFSLGLCKLYFCVHLNVNTQDLKQRVLSICPKQKTTTTKNWFVKPRQRWCKWNSSNCFSRFSNWRYWEKKPVPFRIQPKWPRLFIWFC